MIEPGVMDALSAPEPSERRAAAQQIGESGDCGAAHLLLTQLQKEGERAVKDAILRELGRIWTANPMESIVLLLRDSDPFVRAEAGKMLERRVNDALEGLHQLIQGKDRDLRKFGVDMLSHIALGAPDAMYAAALMDRDINVVISVVEQIGSGRRSAFADHVLDLALTSSQPMLICACMEALADIGSERSLDYLRTRYADAATVPALYQQPFLRVLGGIGSPASIDEICRLIAAQPKGVAVYETSIDAMTRIAMRHQLSELNLFCEEQLCAMLQPEMDPGICFHLMGLLRLFTASSRVALAVLPYVHSSDPALALAAVESLENSNHPAVETALEAVLLQKENQQPDLETISEIRELIRRRPRWNSQPSNSPG